MTRSWFSIIILLLIANTSAQAQGTTSKTEKNLSLNEVVALSLINDPELKSSLAAKDAEVEAKWQGLSALLPSITASYQKNPNVKTDTQGANPFNPSQWTSSNYSATSKVVQLRQPLFRPRQIAAFFQGLDVAGQAEYKYYAALNQAMLRSITSYGNWLTEEANLKFNQASLISAELREIQFEKMQAAGLAGRPDLAQAKTEKHRALMELAIAKQQYQYSKQNLFGLLNDRFIRPAPLTKTPELKTLDLGAQLDDLLSRALINNYEIRSAEKAVEIADLEIKKTYGDHSPTIDLVANHSISDSFSDVAIGKTYKTTSIGVLVSVPIFQGGAIVSTNREAHAKYRKAQADLDTTKNKVTSDFYKSYEALNSAKERWGFAQAAIQSTKLTLESTIKQEKAGLKSKVDIAIAQKDLARAEHDEIQAKVEWLLAKASILSLMGDLEKIIGQEYTSLFSTKF